MSNNSNLFADISSNNTSFHAGAYRSAGHRVIMVKATEGDNYVNPKYGGWCVDAHRHGLAVFHYTFARPENGNPKRQVEHFWNTAREHFKGPRKAPHSPGDTLFIDLETGDPGEGAAWLREAESHLAAISDESGIVCYTFLSYFETGEVTMRSKRIHIAAWGDNLPFHGWRENGLPREQNLFAWQYTDGVIGGPPHRFAGIPGDCDGSVLNPVVVDAIVNNRG